MPIYEYKCHKCGKVYELFQGITEPAVNACKFCNGPAKRLVSLSSFHLKGSGWYVTDYAGKKASATSTELKGETTKPSSPAGSGEEKSPVTAAPETRD